MSQVYSEANWILYHENHFHAMIHLSQFGAGVSLRHDDPRTLTSTTRVLRSKREISMISYQGLIYPHCALRIRNLTVEFTLQNRLHWCDHLANLTCMMQFKASASTKTLFEKRVEQTESRQEAEAPSTQWKLIIDSKGHTSLLTIRWSLKRLINMTLYNLVKEKKLVVELRGKFPSGWQREFGNLCDLEGFDCKNVEEDPLGIVDRIPEAYGLHWGTWVYQ